MANYSFVTPWNIVAAIEDVFEALMASERYPEWWPSFVRYRSLTPGVTGVGAQAEQVVRSVLPYQLTYRTKTTKLDPPREVAYDAVGDLNGRGRFVLEPSAHGTSVTYYWDVATAKRLMNALSPFLRPLFMWHHNWVMRQGERGLNQWLAAGKLRA